MGSHQWGDNLLQGLLDDVETIVVVLTQDIGAHEGEDRHDVMENLVGAERSDGSHEQESLVVSLRVAGSTDAADDQIDAENTLLNHNTLLLSLANVRGEAREQQLVDVLNRDGGVVEVRVHDS